MLSKIAKHGNKLGIYDKTSVNKLRLAIHPDKSKKYLDKAISDDLIKQFNNSSCLKAKEFPCIIKFNNETDVDHVAFALNEKHGMEVAQATDYFHQAFTKHMSADGTVHHSVLTKAICDYFDAVLLYS